MPGEDATQKYQNACVYVCLEAVLDEHFWLRKSKVNPDGLIEDLSAALAANVGTFGFKGAKKKDKIRIRCHAAVPFGGTETETHRQDHDVNEPPPARSEEIRSAFNTPFWPMSWQRPLSDRKVSTSIAGATGWATGIFVPARLTWSNEKVASSASAD